MPAALLVKASDASDDPADLLPEPLDQLDQFPDRPDLLLNEVAHAVLDRIEEHEIHNAAMQQ